MMVDDPHCRRLPVLLRRSWYGLNRAFRRRIAGLDITPDQFTVMRTLIEGDPKGMTQRALADTMSSDPNTIASLVHRMETQGLVTRKHHERDRRARRIALLPKGKAKYLQARRDALKLQTYLLECLPGKQRQEFLKQLEVIACACQDLSSSSI